MTDTTSQQPDAAPVQETPQAAPVVQKKDLCDVAEISMEALLKAGAHFGHQKARRNPKMAQFIFGTRNNTTIIDLSQTVPAFKAALDFLSEVKKSGKPVLLVGTKKQAKNLILDAAAKCDAPYVVERWLGGTFTNFPMIRKRSRYLLKLEQSLEEGGFEKYTKFERMKKKEEAEKLERKMGGVKNMNDLPGAIFVTDLNADHLAVKEAQAKGIPIVAIADTNTDPTVADYAIPANDDALSSLRFIIGHVCKTLQ